jgi:hypothetical protein
MQAVKIEEDGSVRLPKRVLRRFPKKSELMVWAEGDVIVLKRLRPPEPTEFAERLPGEGMSLEEIDEEVQAYRKEKRARET